MSGKKESNRNKFLNVSADVIADELKDRVYYQTLLPYIHKYYKEAGYEAASSFAWHAALDEGYASRILHGKRIDISDTALMGMATAFGFKISRDKEEMFGLRGLFFGHMRDRREDDLAYYGAIYGWKQGLGGEKTAKYQPSPKAVRDQLEIERELEGRFEITDDDDDDDGGGY